SHTLSDYRGKVVFINFMATWCGPCKSEMPDIEALYTDNGANGKDVIVLSIANPKTDGSVAGVTAFFADNGYTYPVLMDTTGDVFASYGVRSFPTTFMIDAEGNVYGYVVGALARDVMDSIVEQTIAQIPAA
ncbi:MAG: TlpA disulfide reductase family protein, partial [Ruthenibacterium sp.]